MTGDVHLNTERDYYGVRNTAHEFTGVPHKLAGWIDVIVFLAAFVGRSWRITTTTDSWTLNYRYPVQS